MVRPRTHQEPNTKNPQNPQEPTEAARLPTPLLPQLAKVLGVTTDQLLGVEKLKDNGKRHDSRLWRRFSQVEKLPPPKRKQIVQILDAFLDSEKLKKAGQM